MALDMGDLKQNEHVSQSSQDKWTASRSAASPAPGSLQLAQRADRQEECSRLEQAAHLVAVCHAALSSEELHRLVVGLSEGRREASRKGCQRRPS